MKLHLKLFFTSRLRHGLQKGGILFFWGHLGLFQFWKPVTSKTSTSTSKFQNFKIFQIFEISKISKIFQTFQKITNFPKKLKITKIYYQLRCGMVLQRVECWGRLGLFLGMANLKTFSNVKIFRNSSDLWMMNLL